ncbi:hypothetical protein QTP88_002618 [Uroleucon formosanum]
MEAEAPPLETNASFKRSEYLISLETVANLFPYSKTLSLVLQSPKLELSKAFSHVKDVIDIIGDIRENLISKLETYFENASDMAALVGEEIRIPHLCGRQTTRIRKNIMSRKDLTLIEKISILDKIKAQPHNTSLRELEKLIGTSKSVLSRLKNNEIAIREQYEKLNDNKSAPVNRKRKREGKDSEVDKAMNE